MANRFSWSSSQGSRNTQRAAIVAQVISAAPAESYLGLPARFSQFLVHGHAAIFRKGVHTSERVVHCLQAVISASILGLEIALLVQSEQCSAQVELLTELCKANFILKLLYMGVIVPGGVVSEVSKDPYEEIPVLPIHNRSPVAPLPVPEDSNAEDEESVPGNGIRMDNM